MIGSELTGKYVIVRTYSADVFAGILDKRDGKEVEMSNARRLWRWAGAASLSQLSQDGTSNPSECAFSGEVPKVLLPEVIEILEVSDKGRESIKGVMEGEQVKSIPLPPSPSYLPFLSILLSIVTILLCLLIY
jgi:hypothetical protein